MIVAGYCRVSTDREDQRNSFRAQCEFFHQYISQNPNWTLYKIYADEGITGTSTKYRKQFNRMIEDAHLGKFQLILTKEVSRFSRNLLDTVIYTRELRGIGVGVCFLTDGIDTMDPDAELRLSIMATIAQEESRRISTRVVWGQTRQMEKGVVFGTSLLGYDVRDGTLIRNEKGAEIVLTIYRKYVLEGWGTSRIAKFLNESGIPTTRGGAAWTPQGIVKILKNEKYAGDLVQRKTCTPNYLSHEKKQNTGQIPLVCIKDHHQPIVDRELWNDAQKILQQRNTHTEKKSGHSDRLSFSGKIFCGICGNAFVARFRYLHNGEKIRQWSCGKAVRQGRAGCSIGRLLREDDATQMLIQAISAVNPDWHSLIHKTCALISGGCTENLIQINARIDALERKIEQLVDGYLSGDISKETMCALSERYKTQIQALQSRKKTMDTSKTNNDQLEDFLKEILEGKQVSKAFCQGVLDRITVYQDRHVDLTLKDLPIIFRYQDSDT